MNLRLYIIFLAALLTLVVPAVADNSIARVYGGVYGWDTFEPLENAIVDVNTTPTQSMVVKSGIYSFELEPGNYSITGRYFQNNTLTYLTTENITIKVGGSYVRDLILLPVYSDVLMNRSENFSVNVSLKNSTTGSGEKRIESAIYRKNNSTFNNSTFNNSTFNSVKNSEYASVLSSNVSYFLIALVVSFLLIVGSYQIYKKQKKIEKNVQPEDKMRYKSCDTSGFLNKPNHLEKAQDQNIDTEIKKDFHVNTGEILSIKGPVIGLESRITSAGPITEPEASLPAKEPVTGPESKISTVNQITDLEAGILVGDVPEENKRGHAIEEAKPIESSPIAESHGNSLKETASSPEIDIPDLKKKLPLPADLQEIMDIIKVHGGRITQKDLRNRLKYSEGKVSLMLADLERRNLIEKFKRGRGNVVILKDK